MITYVASPPSEDPVDRLRELNIQIRELRRIVAELDAENARLEGTVQELTIDLIQAEQPAAHPVTPTPT